MYYLLIGILFILLSSSSLFAKGVALDKSAQYKTWDDNKLQKLKAINIEKMLPPEFKLKSVTQIDAKYFSKKTASSQSTQFKPINFEGYPVTKGIKINNYKPLLTSNSILPIDPKESELKELSPTEFKELQAEIYLNKRPELSLGLYLDLMSGAPKNKILFYKNQMSQAALSLGLYIDFTRWSIELLNAPEYSKINFERLVQNIRPYDDDLTLTLIEFLTKKSDFTLPENSDVFKILYSHNQSRLGRFDQSIDYLLSINDASPWYKKSQMLLSVLYYKSGKVDQAIETLEPLIEKGFDSTESVIKNDAYLLLARLYFQKGNYEKAKLNYTQLSQDSIEWLPAMIEMGWAQILQGDYEGASGNMYSLHSDFFKNQFIPESYLTRTVGYLGLCQYGDALKTSIDLKTRYQPLIDKTSEIKNTWSESQYYDLIKNALNKSKNESADQIPKAWIAWLTRDADFIREQKIINALEDELSNYNTFALTLIQSEKQILEKKKSLLNKGSDSVEKYADQLNWVNIHHHILKKSRDPFRQLRAEGINRIEQLKIYHKKLAGLALKNRMIATHADLLKSFEQLDLLQYEIYAGAGDQLRSVLAGLNIDPSSYVPQKDSTGKVQVKWTFKGEVWKDEIGYFRSSLKNICPDKSGNTVNPPKENE